MALGSRTGAGANQEAIRQHNLGTLLGHVHHEGEVTRAELTARMGLNRSTIAGLVAELEALGVVQQSPWHGERAGAGRPSMDVRPGPHEVSVIAVNLRVDEVDAARVGLGGPVLARVTRTLPANPSPAYVADALVDSLGVLVEDAADDAALVGAGIGLPGVVGGPGSVIRFAPNLGWTDVDLVGLLRDRLGDDLPIQVGNDADLGVLSEHTRGAATGIQDVVYLSGDVGVGGGVIASGKALVGAGGYAGEVGHMRTNPSGRTCRCGSRGCWETEIGAQAVARALHLRVDDLHVLRRRLRDLTDPPPELLEVGRQLGIGVANIVNILNPEVLIFGGILRDLYPVVRAQVAAELDSGTLDAPAGQIRLILPGLGSDSVLLGAAELAFQPLLEDPVAVLARREGCARAVRSACSGSCRPGKDDPAGPHDSA